MSDTLAEVKDGRDSQKRPFLFPHFFRGSEERFRIWVVLIVFGLVLSISWILIRDVHADERNKYNVKLANLEAAESGLPLQMKEIQLQKEMLLNFPEKRLERKKGIFRIILDEEYNPNDYYHQRVLEELSNRFLEPILTTPNEKDNQQRIDDLLAYSRSLLIKNYPAVLYHKVANVWLIVGVLYWLVIFALYNVGLRPEVAEPAFNIIDVGFIAVLIQYTGGLYSAGSLNRFLIIYIASLAAASWDFMGRKDEEPFTKRRLPSKVLLIFGPYAVALALSLFWATCERVVMGETSWMQYGERWVKIFGIACSLCVIFCLILSLRNRRQVFSPAKTG